MRCLAIEEELKPIDAETMNDVLKEEAQVIWELYTEGVLREHYFKDESYLAVLVFECDSAKEVEELVARLPLVRLGYIRFDCMALRPYPGLSRLFAK